MRVLYLTPEFPWPATSGGRVRSVAELKVLSSLPEIEEIVISSVREEEISESLISSLENAIGKCRVLPPLFHPIHLREHLSFLPKVAWARLRHDLPYLAAKWINKELAWRISSELRAKHFDIVYIDHLGMAAYFDLVKQTSPRSRVVLEQHNIESDLFAQFEERSRGIKRWVAGVELAKARAFEKDILRRADAVIAISDADRDGMKTMAGVDSVVVPQVVTAKKREWSSGRSHVVYVGNLAWHPNVEGLDWFARDVWPRVRSEIPNAELRVVGSGLSNGPDGKPKIPDGWRVPGIEVVGFVDDLETVYRDAAVFISPILSGSGIRIKVLEAMKSGIPLVTTLEGALGLPIEHDRHALVTRGPNEFAAAVVRILRSESLQQSLREGAYGYLDSHHSLALAQEKMRRVLGV